MDRWKSTATVRRYEREMTKVELKGIRVRRVQSLNIRLPSVNNTRAGESVSGEIKRNALVYREFRKLLPLTGCEGTVTVDTLVVN